MVHGTGQEEVVASSREELKQVLREKLRFKQGLIGIMRKKIVDVKCVVSSSSLLRHP
jgi:hypothetical protein